MLHGQWSKPQLMAALASVSVEELKAYWDEFKRNAVVDALAFGNVTDKEAMHRAKLMNFTGAAEGADLPSAGVSQNASQQGSTRANEGKVNPREVRVVALPESAMQREVVIDHSDAALIQYHQAADSSSAAQAMVAMTAQMMKSEFFQELRTKQQLGYIVFASGVPMMDVPGLAFVVQSPGYSSQHIAQQTNQFLKAFASGAIANNEKASGDETSGAKGQQTISPINEGVFDQQKLGLLSELTEQPKNISEQGERFWGELTLGDTGFERREQFIAAVKGLSFEKWLTYYQQHFVESQPRVLTVWSKGAFEQGLSSGSGPRIENVAEHKLSNKFISSALAAPEQ